MLRWSQDDYETLKKYGVVESDSALAPVSDNVEKELREAAKRLDDGCCEISDKALKGDCSRDLHRGRFM